VVCFSFPNPNFLGEVRCSIMQELPVWLDEAQYGALKRYAEEQGVCMEKALKDAFFNAVGDSYDHDLSGKL